MCEPGFGWSLRMTVKRLASTTRLTRQGSSTAVTLSREILNAAGVERGDDVPIG